MDKKILCVIPARAGSKGIKNKNLSKIGTESLVEISIKQAIDVGEFTEIFVSTDSDEIFELAKKNGLKQPFKRKPELAEDHVHASEVIFDSIKRYEELGEEFTDVVMLLPTSPLRSASDIKKALSLFLQSKSSSLVSVFDTKKNLINFRFIKGEKLIPVASDSNLNSNRQGLEKIYCVNGDIFISTIESFLRNKSFHTNDCIPYIMKAGSTVDINSQEDLNEARELAKKDETNKNT